MTSPQRLLACRANGALARGRKTPAGISRSAQNALRHGLYAQRGLLPGESPEPYLELRRQFVFRFHPFGVAEDLMIDEMTLLSWRIRRALAIEHGIMQSALEPAGETPEADAVARIAAAFSLPAVMPGLDLVNRCEARFQREFQRLLNSFLTLREENRRNHPKLASEPPASRQPGPTTSPDPVAPSSNVLLFPRGEKQRNDPASASQPADDTEIPHTNPLPVPTAQPDSVEAAWAVWQAGSPPAASFDALDRVLSHRRITSDPSSNVLLFPLGKKQRNDPNSASRPVADPEISQTIPPPSRTTQPDPVEAALAAFGYSHLSSSTLLFPLSKKRRNDPNSASTAPTSATSPHLRQPKIPPLQPQNSATRHKVLAPPAKRTYRD